MPKINIFKSRRWLYDTSLTMLFASFVILAMPAHAQNVSDTLPANPRPNLINRVINYFSESNVPDTTKKFDISFIGGPSYSSETKLSLGMIAAGVYRKNPADTASLPNQVNIYANASITGFYKVGVDGLNYFSNGNRYLIYDVSFESMPDKFWGIGFAQNKLDENETKYNRRHIKLDASYMVHIGNSKACVGPHISMDYVKASRADDYRLWNGENLSVLSNSVGLKFEYDTRDYRFNAYSGIYACIDQMFAPRFLGNKYAFSYSDFTAAYYQRVWKGGVVATNLHTRFSYGNTPWSMMSKVGGSYIMRGYWEGRYNDKCAADATVELRQNIYHRSGIAVWGGIGEVFDKPRQLFKGHPLPNFGIGYRWEFKKRVNIRIDYGWGRHQSGVVFNLNEAF